jgi:hypothetical protein
MTTNSWIGAGLVILVIVFFIVAFFVGGEITGNQFAIVKYLGAFCAALGGGFLILGQAVFDCVGLLSSISEHTRQSINLR